MKSLLIIFFVLTFSLPVFAAPTIPVDLEAQDLSDTTISLDWTDSPGAIGYYLYYGTKTGSGGSYEMEGVDLIEKSEFVLEKLIPQTKYYIALTSVDEFASESLYSDELEYSTLKVGQKNQANTLRISEVQVVDENTLEFLFSTSLNTAQSAPFEFRIEEISSGDEIMVDIAEVDPTNSKNVIVVLNQKLQAAKKYKVTVLDIQDSTGKTIESGIDAFLNFSSPLSFEKEVILPPVEELPKTEDIELNAAPEESITTVGPILVGNNAGVTVSSTNMSGGVLQTAQENAKLPQTGPTQWLLILISLLFGAIIFFKNQRKLSSQR